jgi:hypothetical protein
MGFVWRPIASRGYQASAVCGSGGLEVSSLQVARVKSNRPLRRFSALSNAE